jgi:hypothetical protein
MEIGLKIIQNSNNKYRHESLSVKVSLNGLSFCIIDESKSSVVFAKLISFDQKITAEKLLDKITHCFNTEETLKHSFDKVSVIHDNNIQTVVPKALFNEKNLADYLKYSVKLLQTDFIAYENLATIEAVNVYVPYVNVNNYIFERFGSFEYKHSSTILLNTLLKNDYSKEGLGIYVNVKTSDFDLIITKNKTLLLHNKFEYQTAEDFIYYILFTMEQLELNPNEMPLEIFGNISTQSELYKILYKYVRYVELKNTKSSYTVPAKFSYISEDFTLLNSF